MIDIKKEILTKHLELNDVCSGVGYIDDGENAFKAIYDAMDEYMAIKLAEYIKTDEIINQTIDIYKAFAKENPK